MRIETRASILILVMAKLLDKLFYYSGRFEVGSVNQHLRNLCG